jgi:cation-transporting ATPase E
VQGHIASGQRVLLLAHAPSGLAGERLPPKLLPAAVVGLEERIRPEAAATLQFFRAQGVAVKVLSGDDPQTVAAVARRVGVEGADHPVDARDLPAEGEGLGAAVEASSVFGRVAPHHKRAVIAALQARGHVVAMTGDGVNDVLALKDADIGVAMGSGSPASRAVAPVVLLDNSFSALPGVVAEGRRVIANVERVANLFVTKTAYALMLALAVGVARLPFPFYPRHLTIVSTLTIGIPAFFLALAPNNARARPRFTGRVLRFALPAGTVAAGATLAGYAIARDQPDVSLPEARTVATLVLFGVAIWVLAILARPLTLTRGALVALMGGGFVLVASLPVLRDVFALDMPPLVVVLAAIGVIALADSLLEAGWRLAGWVSHVPHRHGRNGSDEGAEV